MEFIKKHYYGIIMTVITVILIILSAYLGYTMARRDEASSPADEEEAEQVSAGQKTAPGCVVDWTYVYKKCSHKVAHQANAEKDMLGVTLAMLKERYPRLGITDFSPTHIAAVKKLDGYCPDHYILKQEGSSLLLYQTKLGAETQNVVKIYTNANLNDEAKGMVEKGKVFSSEGEVKAFLYKNREL